MQNKCYRAVIWLLILAFLLQMTACGSGTRATKIALNRSTLSVKVGQTGQLEVKLTPSDATDKVQFQSADEGIATVTNAGVITGVAEGKTSVTATAGKLAVTCAVTVEPAAREYEELPSVNGFKAFPRGGLLGGEGGTYYPIETIADGDKAVTFRGKGGLSWPDTVNMTKPSAMGGYYESALPLDNLTLTWRLDTPMETENEHWYVIALEDRKQLFNSWDGEDPTKTLFFMIGFGEGTVYLMPHYRDVMDLGESWSFLGSSQGVPYQPGDTITLQFVKTDEGYVVYLNECCQVFGNIRSPYLYITEDLFPDEEVWVMAAAHIGNPEAQYDAEYAYTLGLGEPAENLPLPGDVGVEPNSVSCNGFSTFPYGGLVGGTTYDPNITLDSCGSTDRVKVTGCGGTNYGDALVPRSTMGVYSQKKYALNNLEILYSVEEWIQSGDHWYAIALTPDNDAWFEDDGSDCALFFMFAYDNGKVLLKLHYIGNGTDWTFVADSQGVPAVGGQYSIFLQKVSGGYSVYMRNAEQSEYVLQSFGGKTVIADKIVKSVLPDGYAYLMAGGYAATYDGQWSFVLGAHENASLAARPVQSNGASPAKKQTLNGFTAFPYGGLIGGKTYNNQITLDACNSTDRVKVSGYGGTNYGDNATPRSTMGVYSENRYKLDGLEILYSVEDWVQSGDHWYAIALTPKNGRWFEDNGTDCALFLLFAYDNGKIILRPHYVGNGKGWTYMGDSQGVAAVGGQYSIVLKKVEGGYSIYMKNAEQTQYVLQSFGGTTVLPETLVNSLLPDGKAYLMAGGYVATYEGRWSFILGAHENVTPQVKPETTPPEPAQKNTVNGFTAFPYGGLVGGVAYNNEIQLDDCGGTDRVKATGYGGTNYGDTEVPRSTMGVYSEKQYPLDGLEILFSVEDWIQSGEHWYAFALTQKNATWFEDNGSDGAIFFMFAYDNGKIILRPHHIGNGTGWSYLGDSQGVVAAGGQYSILLQKTDGGYSVYMKNAEQTDYTLQTFGGKTELPANIVDGLFPQQTAYLMAGGYVATYEGQWSFVLGAHEGVKLPDPGPIIDPHPDPVDTLNGFTAYENGGLVGGATYDTDIQLEDCGSTDRVKVTGRGGTNYGDTEKSRSTMGVYSEQKYALDGLEILYSVESWVQSGEHWYAIALTQKKGVWFEDNGADNALFFLFAFNNGNVTLNAHHIGNGAGWTSLGESQGVPAVGGQYSIYLKKVTGGYAVYMKNAEQTDFTLQTFGTLDVLPEAMVNGLFADGSAYLTAGGYVATYEGQWSFVLGAHENADYPVQEPVQVQTVNGFAAYANGGLVGGATYDTDIQLEDCGSTDRVKVTGRGGTNYGDNEKSRSTMGVYSESKYALDGLEILYSVESWVQSGEHWYAIALTQKNGVWFEDNGADNALFFLFAFNNGKVTLNAHHIGNGAGWTSLGESQGVPAVGGQYSIYLKKVTGGYAVYMKNAEQTDFTLQTFGTVSVLPEAMVNGLFADGSAYLTAGGYVATYEGQWSFILGAHENADYPVQEPVQVKTVNGFAAFATGGLVGGATYDTDIQLEDCGSTDRVKVTGRGGTNYGDNTKPRSTMGVYSTRQYAVDGLEILYSVESWVQSGDHWYAFALTRSNDHWFENNGADCALFFMFSYQNGSVILQAHHIGNGAGWSYIGASQGVPAAGGQYSICLKKVDGGYSVYMKNASQSEYTLQSFGTTTVLAESIVNGLFPSGSAYLMAGAYVASYTESWSFILGAHENATVTLPQKAPNKEEAEQVLPTSQPQTAQPDALPPSEEETQIEELKTEKEITP